MLPKKGKVYLVGAGPGDEGLITVRAIDCLKMSDVVIYDYLANKELLQYCPENCEMYYVGKRSDSHTISQPEINKLIVAKANEGKIVTRFKGGDPFIFGRGGEEMLELADNDIEFEVVPGITAATAAAAYSGISLTHRGYASTLAFITGHEDPDKKDCGIKWEKIATGIETLVFYMGIKNLESITQKLTENGRDPQTPVTLIRWGTYNYQETLTGTLTNISGLAQEKNFKPPAVIIIGEVAKPDDKLKWFENKPLYGKNIIITRSRKQMSSFKHALSCLGANVTELPTIEIRTVKDTKPVNEALNKIHEFSQIIFTSVNAVEIFFKIFSDSGRDARALSGIIITVTGSETGKALEKYGIIPDIIPEKFTAEGVIEAIKKTGRILKGEKILLPCSAIARDLIHKELEKEGAEITRIPVYNNVIPDYSEDHIKDIFSRKIDLVTFTSSSTVVNLCKILKKHGNEYIIPSLKGASIGPATSTTAKDSGINIVLEADTHTITGLSKKIKDYYS